MEGRAPSKMQELSCFHTIHGTRRDAEVRPFSIGLGTLLLGLLPPVQQGGGGGSRRRAGETKQGNGLVPDLPCKSAFNEKVLDGFDDLITQGTNCVVWQATAS
jgi:hypothetical protein